MKFAIPAMATKYCTDAEDVGKQQQQGVVSQCNHAAGTNVADADGQEKTTSKDAVVVVCTSGNSDTGAERNSDVGAKRNSDTTARRSSEMGVRRNSDTGAIQNSDAGAKQNKHAVVRRNSDAAGGNIDSVRWKNNATRRAFASTHDTDGLATIGSIAGSPTSGPR